MNIKIKRVYDVPDKQDGQRILVDRLWPRGLTKARASVDLWLKDVAPSTELRKWFGHIPGKWAEFKVRYHAELKARGKQVSILRAAAEEGPVTLVYGAKDKAHNEAVVLRESLRRRTGSMKLREPQRAKATHGTSERTVKPSARRG